MANQPQYGLPEFQFRVPSQGQAGIQDIFNILRTPPQSMTGLALPAIQAQFAQTGQALAPALGGIQEATASRVAQAQSEAMKRGMTGSDIEASMMQAERATGAQQEAGLLGQVAMQQIQTMTNAIMQTLSQDTAAEQNMFAQLAQAIGEKVSRDDQIAMFNAALEAQKAAARAGKKQSFWQSLAQVAMPIIGAGVGAMAMPAAPWLGALAGFGAGSGGSVAITQGGTK